MASDSGSEQETKVEPMEANNIGCDGDDPDPVVSEIEVVVRHTAPNGELYRVQFPTRKVNPFGGANLKTRFKKNVKLLEMRMRADTKTASFDRAKAEHLASVSSGSKGVGTSAESPRMLDEEVYEGRSFSSDLPLHYAAGFFRDGVFFLSPLRGVMEMRRSIAYLNNQGKGKASRDIDGDATESDSDTGASSAPIRVRFARPETERQKKRREESSLHRSKLIEQDPWVPLTVYRELDPESVAKRGALTLPPEPDEYSYEKVDPEQLIQEAIIGEKLNELDLNNCEQLISLRRIRHLPEVQQVRAVIIKAKLISTSEAESYVSSSISRDLLITRLRDCAHLVNGIWIIKSELLYQGDGQTVFRAARDLALALFSANLPVKRSDLQNAFGLSGDDLDSILSTVANHEPGGERGWILKVPPDAEFGDSLDELNVVVEEKEYWHKRWEEIHGYLQAEHERVNAAARRRRNSSRRSSVSDSSSKKRSSSGTKTVVID